MPRNRLPLTSNSRNLWAGFVGPNTCVQDPKSRINSGGTKLATVIRPKRTLLLIKAIAAVGFGAIAGWFMQSWSFFESSSLGKLSTGTGLPIIALAVWGGSVILIGTVAWDHWKFRIEIHQEHLLLCDHLGTTIVRYDNIAETSRCRRSVRGLRSGIGRSRWRVLRESNRDSTSCAESQAS